MKNRPSPSVVVDVPRLERNLSRMQTVADAAQVELWPHIKTHKMLEVGRRQLTIGAKGFTCAKLSEAEALLEAGVRRVFWAHSMAHPENVGRLLALSESLDELSLAVTSVAHQAFLEGLLLPTGKRFPVAMAVDTGLGREGVRSLDAAVELAARIRASECMDLVAIYTHEGQAYSSSFEEIETLVERVHAQLLQVRSEVGGELPLWPGCSVTASMMAGREAVARVRPGAYVFGDLSQAESTGVIGWDEVALTVEATVVDRPEAGLALIDAGSKVFSSDRMPGGPFARPLDRRDFAVTRVSEEHGFVTGSDVNALEIGERVAFVPAHVCPVVNLTDRVCAKFDSGEWAYWDVSARGCVR